MLVDQILALVTDDQRNGLDTEAEVKAEVNVAESSASALISVLCGIVEVCGVWGFDGQ